VIDLLASGHPLDPLLDRRMVTALALISEQEEAGDNPVGGMGGFNFTASPAQGLANLSALDQFSDSAAPKKKTDQPPPGNLNTPGAVSAQ
jgi:hypothetical protein